MDNRKFTKILRAFITSGNHIISEMIKIRIVNNNGIPNIFIKTTDDKDELHILSLQINFISKLDEHIKEFLHHYVKDADSRDEFMTILVKTIYLIQEQIVTKLSKTKEATRYGNSNNNSSKPNNQVQ